MIVFGVLAAGPVPNPVSNQVWILTNANGLGGYILNLSTKRLTMGTYNINFTVTGDSFTYAAPFQVK